jgi:hypothetical protein
MVLILAVDIVPVIKQGNLSYIRFAHQLLIPIPIIIIKMTTFGGREEDFNVQNIW